MFESIHHVQGHHVIITTETLREIKDENRHSIILKGGKTEQGGGKKIEMVDTGEQTSHDMTEIAIIKKNTIPVLRMEQALKGRISPNEKDAEELTILFKNGMEGTKQEATENIAKWARRIKIEKEIKWIGKPKEEKGEKETNKESIEGKIAEWMLDPEAKYSWGKKRGQRRNGNTRTVPEYGRDNAWKHQGKLVEDREKRKVIKEMQQKVTEILFRHVMYRCLSQKIHMDFGATRILVRVPKKHALLWSL